MKRIALWTVVLPLVFACGEDKTVPAAGAEGSAAAPARDAGAVAKAAAPDAAPAPPPDLTGGLPPVAMTPAAKEAAAKAAALNKEALVLHRAGKLDEAAARYREAVTSDPSHLIARYNLASALASKGDTPQALAILAQFAAAGPACAKCTERLARARNDGEWKALWENPQFVMLTTGGAVAPRSQVMFMGFVTGESRTEGEIAFDVLLEPAPGWVVAPALEVSITAGGKKLAAKSWAPDQIKGATLTVPLPVPPEGSPPVVATVKADGVVAGTVKAKAEQLSPESYPYLVKPIRRPPKVARCDGLECPDFPALSPDGKVVVTRDIEELMSPGDRCGPPEGLRTRFYQVSSKGPVKLAPSQNLTGFEVMTCEGGDEVTLPDKYKVKIVEEERVVLADPSGKGVASAKTYNRSDLVCTSAAHPKVVVVRTRGSLGGDCDETPDVEYLTFTY
ncbi:MAG TPA: tetratricopeptide repeat protein [Kofleriaceae bacterium]|nr:tetratricopeptide repeat protein [Kofleriaceae bacterium]